VTTARVLILDDNANVAATLEAIARRSGHEARSTTDAQEFLRVAADWCPSHLILDLVMPETDGMQVIHALAALRCQAGIIISSGAGARVLDAAQRAAVEGGLVIVGTLPKPFRPQAVRNLLAVGPRDLEHAAAGPPSLASATSAELRKALAANALEVFYQPKIRCSDGSVAGVEALARWPCGPYGRPVPPAEFVPLAERDGLIGHVTWRVIEQAFAWFASCPTPPTVHLAVNISAVLLGDAGLVDQLGAAAASHGLEASRVVLEVTETGALADPLTTLEVATRLRLRGFSLSIDDFGVGYSSLVQLARLPFAEIKIDAAFVRDIDRSAEARKIVGAVIGLGRSLDLQVTAEGVEDERSLKFLRDAGCEFAQGYFIARPASGDATAAWLRTRRTISA
jgi:EAL domain-containing protein (putative c-di-GMP-specific phosphodiesterase class I)/FixJ family two-component response regulator